MTKDEALKLAMEFLDTLSELHLLGHDGERVRAVIKQALAAPVQPEFPQCAEDLSPKTLVYTAKQVDRMLATPPAAHQQWVGLTPREIYNLWEDSGVPFVDWDSFASITRAIEAKLRNKNGWRQQHVTDGSPCWCEPETSYTDPETGASVIVHKDPQ